MEHYRNEIVWNFTKKYADFIQMAKDRINSRNDSLPHGSHNQIWVCWLQGLESAPEIVKICVESIYKAFPNREVVLITNENYGKYVTLPEFIVNKYNCGGGIIPAMFSDILRVNLLIEHGGTWIDATTLCTQSEDQIPAYMLNSEFFIPRTIHEETMQFSTQTVSYYMSAFQNNKILLLVRDLLYHYWEHNDISLEYLIIYYFMEIAIQTFPEEWEKVVPFPRANFLVLADNWQKPYSEELFDELTSFCPFHKLSYRFLPDSKDGKSIYDYLLSSHKPDEGSTV